MWQLGYLPLYTLLEPAMDWMHGAVESGLKEWVARQEVQRPRFMVTTTIHRLLDTERHRDVSLRRRNSILSLLISHRLCPELT